MQPIKLKLSSDAAHAALTVAGATMDLSAHDIDRLIRDLAAVRAKMTPVFLPASSSSRSWTVRAAEKSMSVIAPASTTNH